MKLGLVKKSSGITKEQFKKKVNKIKKTPTITQIRKVRSNTSKIKKS